MSTEIQEMIVEPSVEPEFILSDSGSWEMINNESDPLALHSDDMLDLPDEKCKYCFETFDKEDITDHLRTHHGLKEKKCVWKNEDGSICGKIFKRLDHLERHNRIHDGSKPHKCVECLRTFSRLDNMKKHMQTHSKINSETHSSNKPYNCEVCNKSFPGRYFLKKHLRTHPVVNELIGDLGDGKGKSKRLRTSEVGFNQNYHYYH